MKSTLGGTGLGLSTSLALVEAWGGKILCESAQGMGTTFTIVLSSAGGLVLDTASESKISQELSSV